MSVHDDDSLVLTDFLVAFVDILGFRDRLRDIREVPHDEAGRNEVIGILRETYGRVRSLRDAFDRTFKEASRISPSLLAALPPDKREQFRMARSIDARQRGIADAFVISVPLAESLERHVVANASSVLAALHSIGGIYLTALSLGVPLRGGIDVGPALDADGEIYGPPLVTAYELECKIASYPRVLLGEGLLRYVDYLIHRPTDTPLASVTSGIGQRILSLITRDVEDGRPMLDPLSAGMYDISPAVVVESGEKALSWANEQHEQFVAAGDHKLSDRYRRLCAYLMRGRR